MKSMDTGKMDIGKMDMAGMNEVQKGYMDAMMKMDGPGMQVVQADDADLAFVCGMIAHHQGAVEMAKVELAQGDNKRAKAFAQEVMDSLTKEIEKFKEWVAETPRKQGPRGENHLTKEMKQCIDECLQC